MISVYLFNGTEVDIPKATVAVWGYIKSEEGASDTAGRALLCRDAEGALLGAFLEGQIAGYALTDDKRPKTRGAPRVRGKGETETPSVW